MFSKETSSEDKIIFLNIDIGGGTTDFALMEYDRLEKTIGVTDCDGHSVSGGIDLDTMFLDLLVESTDNVCIVLIQSEIYRLQQLP
jgi:molecular chaperone DnaK (HSP70)